ncbi:MAG: kelch repeat-containing protein [Promethearchaeota archaeon]
MIRLDVKTRIIKIIIISFLLLGSFISSTSNIGFNDLSEKKTDVLLATSQKPSYFWRNMNPLSGPSTRIQHSMVYDSTSGKVILFGGWDYPRDVQLNDTWVYDLGTNTWTQKSPVNSPNPRRGHSMVYDSNSNKVILFGGYDGSFLNDIWVYDLGTNTWTQKSPVNSPSPRYLHSMVYDLNTDQVILFGGWNGYLADTWVYNLTADTWTLKNPSAETGSRQEHSMVYDSNSAQVILFGGYDGTDVVGKTLAYDLTLNTWTPMNPSTSPDARVRHSMVYDSTSDKVILFGGTNDQFDACFADTWIYDLSTNAWIQMNPSTSPGARAWHSMVYDSTSDKVILFGGNNFQSGTYFADTWVLESSPLKLLSPEDKTYYAPMSGYYPASFGFENELHATAGTDLEFIDEYHAPPIGTYVDIGVHDGPIYGHNKVLHIGDAQAGHYTYGVHYFDNPPTTGTIEFYNLVDNIHMPYTGANYFHLRATDDTIAVEMRINAIGQYLSNIEYFDGSSWQSIADQVSYKWYYHSISFNCETGVNGQFNWIIFDENETEVGRVENIEFQNDVNTLDELYLASDIPTYFGATRWDAFGFSWDPNYNVGDNLKEGLLLNYTTTVPLDWAGYSLDGGTNVTIFGNTTIPMPVLGTHTIQVFGNDSTGIYYHSGLRSFQIKLYPPSAPLNLIATVGENVIELSWSIPGSDGGSKITHYNVYRGTVSGSYSLLGDTSNTGFKDTTAIGETTYYYAVTAVNAIGESAFSNEAKATPSEPQDTTTMTSTTTTTPTSTTTTTPTSTTTTTPTTTTTTTPTTTTKTKETGAPGITPSPGILTILLFLGTLEVLIRRRKKS